MSQLSGERARRIHLGIAPKVSGAEEAQARATVRYSINDRATKQAMAQRISAAAGKRRDKNQFFDALQREVNRAEEMRQSATDRFKRLGENEGLLISDHAVIRFLERVMEMDVEAIRAQIARIIPPTVLEHERAIYTRAGRQYVVKDGVLVTVLDEHMDELVESHFAIDEAGFGKPVAPRSQSAVFSRAARLLGSRGKRIRLARDNVHAQLAAELGRQNPLAR